MEISCEIIRDLLPLAEHPKATQAQHCIPASDQSIVLHSAHSLVREKPLMRAPCG